MASRRPTYLFPLRPGLRELTQVLAVGSLMPAALEAVVALLNSSSPDQRARGVALIERGEFAPPDSVKVRCCALPLHCHCSRRMTVDLPDGSQWCQRALPAWAASPRDLF